uniref:Gag-pol polyprotein n=1 Tax=Gossypium raimondii TaxID=29730 RepID=A0A0D2Q5P5_GOSRA|nr:hypothetical protein B456_002G177800 [Gossypium raimondii]
MKEVGFEPRLSMMEALMPNQIHKNETIFEFYVKLYDLTNQIFTLEDEYFNSKLTRKVLYSFPERFNIKVTTIKEAKNIDTMCIDELIRSIQNFEINLDETKRNKGKGEKGITL